MLNRRSFLKLSSLSGIGCLGSRYSFKNVKSI